MVECTCHPDDNPPKPCPQKYALGACFEAAYRAAEARVKELETELQNVLGDYDERTKNLMRTEIACERAEVELRLARGALEPFKRIAGLMEQLNLPDDKPLRDILPGLWPTLGDCRKARAALEAFKKDMQES